MSRANKKAVFLVRITKEDKKEFYDMCDMQAIRPAEVIRRMMHEFCDNMRELEGRRLDREWGNDYEEDWDD